MNMVELQLDFYRRFNDAVSHLTIARSGLLCNLLGSTTLNGSKSLSCVLSMGVSVAARRLDGGTIKVENTSENTCMMYNIHDAFRGNSRPEREIRQLFNKTGFNGAQLLYDTDIPKGFNYEPSLRCAVLKALYSINRATPASPTDAALLCGNGKKIAHYTALFASKPGWCSFIDSKELKSFPLPMTGLLLIIARGRKRSVSLPKKSAEREIEILKRTHPMVFTYSDIEPHMVAGPKFRFLKYIAEENQRVDNACRMLRSCRINKFAEIANESQLSMEKYLKLTDEQVSLAHFMKNTEGCMCARAWGNSVYAIVEAELADYVVKKTRDKFEDNFGYAPQLAVTKCE